MTRRAIVSVAVGEWYPRGQQRLFNSLEEKGENATRLFWRDEYPPGSPTHEETPYGFKVAAFDRARELGFDVALWLDASCWALRELGELWSRIERDGYYLEPDGHVVGEWTSDRTLELLRLNRDEAMGIPLVEGKVIGLDLRDETAIAFLDGWRRLRDGGGFAGAWTNDQGQVSGDSRCRGHRHDIACASPLAWSFGLALQPFKRVWFPSQGDAPAEAVLMAQGL